MGVKLYTTFVFTDGLNEKNKIELKANTIKVPIWDVNRIKLRFTHRNLSSKGYTAANLVNAADEPAALATWLR